MIDANILATGSTGNAVIVQKNILIDCGVPFRTVEPYIWEIKLVLLTHQHGDHFKPSTLRRMSLEKPLMRFGCGPFLVDRLVKAGVSKQQIDVLQPKMLYGYGIVNVIPFPLYHDVPNYGFKLHFPEGKVFYATDTRSLNGIVALNYDLYLVEANYKDEELRARMDEKIAAGEYAYEERVVKNHLSEKRCNDWLYKNMGPTSEYIYLHQHIERGGVDEGKDP